MFASCIFPSSHNKNTLPLKYKSKKQTKNTTVHFFVGHFFVDANLKQIAEKSGLSSGVGAVQSNNKVLIS